MTAVPTLPTISSGTLPTSQINQITSAVAFLMSPPTAKLRQTVAQSIASATFTAITFDAEDRDFPSGQHDNVTNNTRFTAVYPGWYEVSGGFTFASSTAGTRRLGRYLINGNTYPGSLSGQPPNSTVIGCPMRTVQLYLSVGDYVELHVFQDTGGALSTFVANTEYQSSLEVRWVST